QNKLQRSVRVTTFMHDIHYISFPNFILNPKYFILFLIQLSRLHSRSKVEKVLKILIMFPFITTQTFYIHCMSEIQHVGNCPIDCASIYYNGVRRSGLYTVVPLLARMPVEVYCDMDTDGGGWTVIQRRVDGSVSFDRSWRDYRDGFGDLHSEFWLGNNHIHELSTQGDYSLRIDLEDWSIQHKHALYQSFSVEDEEHQYRLHVSDFSGTVQDSFGWYHDKQHFSTPDTGNICAEISHGGWWYNQCFYANLNGVYYRVSRGSLGPDGIVWYSWKDSDYYSLRKVSMMIRPLGQEILQHPNTGT
uniref:Si:ch211-203k16.3 n=1 Tax=Poecilia latipinna TaxID=48699 RepID=A0A3B3UU65_9TELE